MNVTEARAVLKQHLRFKTEEEFLDYYDADEDDTSVSPDDGMSAESGITYPQECMYVLGSYSDFCTMVVYKFHEGGYLVGDELQGSCACCQGRIFDGDTTFTYEEWCDKMDEFIEDMVWFTNQNDVEEYATSKGYKKEHSENREPAYSIRARN